MKLNKKKYEIKNESKFFFLMKLKIKLNTKMELNEIKNN